MDIDLPAFLKSHPAVLLFLIIGIGYLIGKIKIKGFELGPAGGVLFAGLFFGHYGYELPSIIEALGFIFFIYSVGFQSGARFFASFKQDGFRYIILSIVIASFGLLLALGASYAFDLEQGYAAGLLGGAMTSTPTLAAAQDAVSSGLAATHDLSAAQINSNITVGYAITYVFGLVGLILFMRLFPRLMGIDLPAEAAALAKKMKISEDDDDDELRVGNKGLPAVRVYKVSNEEIHAKTLDDLRFLQTTGCVILKIKRGEHMISPGDNTTIETGDLVAVAGHFSELLKAATVLGGPEIQDEMLAEFPIETHQVVVINPQMIGKTIRESGVINEFSCFMTKFARSNTELPLNLDLKLEKGDVLVLTGIKERLEQATGRLGHAERPIHETDLVTFAFGIVIGIVLGTLTVKLGSVPIGIGMAGGLLVTGLLVGHFHARHRSFGRVPRAARFILMEMGILFFLGGVGLRAGHGLIEGLQSVGIQIFISGIAITLIPVICGFVVGRYILKMHPAILMGAITGSMTSTPALVIVNNTAKSSLPALGYTGAYAFANIILTLAGQLIMLF